MDYDNEIKSLLERIANTTEEEEEEVELEDIQGEISLQILLLGLHLDDIHCSLKKWYCPFSIKISLGQPHELLNQ